MKVLVTGSAGHLGEALMRTLPGAGHTVVGLDLKPSPTTTLPGSIVDPDLVRTSMQGIDAVLHTATLHKPHVATHARQAFVDTNISGTLNLLEASVEAGVSRFVFTSTTSVYGRALVPAPGEPAAWIDESVMPLPKNIYGVTKKAAEELCELFAHRSKLPVVILRTSRFFPEADDSRDAREAFDDANLKVNELLYRRGDIEDMVSAHLAALERAPDIGFGIFNVSATTPFQRSDCAALRRDASAVLSRYVPDWTGIYAERGWRMLPTLDRVYDNAAARAALGWTPRHDFSAVLRRLAGDPDWRSPLARTVGSKGYHDAVFEGGPFPVA